MILNENNSNLDIKTYTIDPPRPAQPLWYTKETKAVNLPVNLPAVFDTPVIATPIEQLNNDVKLHILGMGYDTLEGVIEVLYEPQEKDFLSSYWRYAYIVREHDYYMIKGYLDTSKLPINDFVCRYFIKPWPNWLKQKQMNFLKVGNE